MRFEVSATANQALQGEINRSIIYNYIRENGPVSRTHVARTLGISPSAVTRVVNALVREKYLLEAGKVETPVGKRPILLRINGQKGSVLAVDLSQDRVRLGLYDFGGGLLSERQGFRIQGRRESVNRLMGEMHGFLAAYLKDTGLNQKRLGLGMISLGIPADVDVQTGRILSACLYADWYDINFKEKLEQEFGLPALVEKDVTLSVLAEKRVGAGRNHRNIAFIEVSNGVSAGIICDDRLVRGASGSAGQIAFQVINPESERFRSANIGYLDRHASMQGIRARMAEQLSRGRRSSVTSIPGFRVDDLDPAAVCQAALEGDELAGEVIAHVVGLLGRGLLNLVLAVNPEVLILGGHVSNLPGAERLFASAISEYIEQAISFKVPEVRISTLGEEVVLVGASLRAVEALVAGSFPYRLGGELA
jgi:predicted NBD/HSP70 family sugar kinase